MTKTPISARFTQQLIKVNDQVCFSALRQWEFERALEPLVVNRPADFTTTVFPANPFSESIYRKIGDLPLFLQESEQVALRMGVIASVEYSLAYLKDVQKFRQSFVASDVDEVENDAEEEELRLKVRGWSGNSPTPGYFRTLGYLRLLRNHYAHVNDKLHQSFSTHIRSYATSLNRFWNNGVTDVHGIDFRTLSSIALTPHLTFGIMNLLRVCMQHIDEMVADTLTLRDAVQFLVDDILQTPKGRQLRASRVSSKVRTRLRTEWHIDESLSVVSSEVEQVLADRR